MSDLLLDIIADPNGNYYFSGGANGVGESIIYALIGFAVVFLGIVLIIFIIWLIGWILRKTNNFEIFRKLSIKGRFSKKRKTETQEETASGEEEIPDDVKAAIVAAIMCFYENEKPEIEFIVRKIKRIEVL